MIQNKTKSQNYAADDELVDVLTAISVVSMRLAKKLTIQRQSTEGGKTDEQDDHSHRRTAQMRYHY
ncbi:MAG: hypothetical protein ACYCWE_02810 [Eubacteriales bacterium]